jgi:uncharacterized protein YukE
MQVLDEAAVFSAAMLNAREAGVEEAARRERVARVRLEEATKPSDRDWTPEAQAGYEARLARWRAASRELVAALNRLAADREAKQHR